jgi:integrase/recombinase XerD
MFEELFAGPIAHARQCESPFSAERRDFLRHLKSRGYARGTLRAVACELIVIATRLDLSGTRSLGASHVDAAARRWAAYQLRRHYSTSARLSIRNFRYWAEQWLRYWGRWIDTPPVVGPFDGLLSDFTAYMADAQALAPASIRSRWRTSMPFSR